MNVQSQPEMDNATFLDWLQGREGRYELAGGRVMMMTGGTVAHGMIVGNIFELLRSCLDRKEWSVFTDFGIDVRPGTVRYADILVDHAGAKRTALTAKAPVIIAEVLSPSTMKTDLGDKAADYLQIATLVTYLVFAQDEVKAWAYCRSSDNQIPPGLKVFAGPDVSIRIPALHIELPLIDVYRGVEFD